MEIKLNLSSKPYLNRQSVRLWLLLGCAVLTALLVLSGYAVYQNTRQIAVLDSRFKELDRKLEGAQLSPVDFSAERYAEVKADILFANEIVAADQFRWTEFLSRFENLLPNDVALQSIQPAYEQQRVNITGIARDVAAMNHFIDNLLASEDFGQAYLHRHGSTEITEQNESESFTSFALEIREAF